VRTAKLPDLRVESRCCQLGNRGVHDFYGSPLIVELNRDPLSQRKTFEQFGFDYFEKDQFPHISLDQSLQSG